MMMNIFVGDKDYGIKSRKGIFKKCLHFVAASVARESTRHILKMKALMITLVMLIKSILLGGDCDTYVTD